MEACLETPEEELGGVLEAIEIGPPAVATELVLEVAPDALDEVQLRRIRREPERSDSIVVVDPPAPRRVALVIADVVEHHDDLAVWEGGREVIEERDEGGPVLLRVNLPDHPAAGVVERSEHGEPPVLTGGGHRQRPAPAPPDLRQPWVAVDLALVQIDEAQAVGCVGVGNAFPCSHPKT